MPPLAVDIGIFIYEYLKILVAVIAVVLAVTWKKMNSSQASSPSCCIPSSMQ